MKLDEAITAFTADYSYNTQKTYTNALRRFVGWARETGWPITDVEELDPKWAIPFARSMKREGLSSSSITLYLIALVQFLEWLKVQGNVGITAEQFFTLKAQVKDWNSKNRHTRLARLPKEDAVIATVELAHEIEGEDERQRLFHLRNAAMIDIWASTGCRISEAANLKRDDLNPSKMTAMVRGGKGNKDREIVFASKEAWDTVQTYLRERDKLGFTVQGEEPVLARHDYEMHNKRVILPVGPESMRTALKRILKEAGVEDTFTPHQLRHRAGTNLLRKTGNPAIVQQYLGHKNVSTTIDTYTHLTNEDVIEAVRGG